MTKAELMKLLQEKETLREQTEMVHSQLIGQISLLRELLKKEEMKTPEEAK